jgi:hypothetical protein
MKLPRGAVQFGERSAFHARGELDGTVSFSRFIADPYDDDFGPRRYNVVDGWRHVDGFTEKRAVVRKLARRLLSALDDAEKKEHGVKLARRVF